MKQFKPSHCQHSAGAKGKMPSWAALEWLQRVICCTYMTVFAGDASDRTEDKRVQVPEDHAPRPDTTLVKVLHEDIPYPTAQQPVNSSEAERQSPRRVSTNSLQLVEVLPLPASADKLSPAVAAIAASVKAATMTKNRSGAVSRTDSTGILDVIEVLPLPASADRLSPAVAAIAASVKAATITKNRSRAVSRTDSTGTLDVIEVRPLLARNKLSPAVAAIAATVAAPATPTQSRSRAVSRTDSASSLEVTEVLPLLAGDTMRSTAAAVVWPPTPAALDAGAAVQAVSPAVQHTILSPAATPATPATAAAVVGPPTPAVLDAGAAVQAVSPAVQHTILSPAATPAAVVGPPAPAVLDAGAAVQAVSPAVQHTIKSPAATPATAAAVVGPPTPAVLDADAAVQAVSPAVQHIQPRQTAPYAPPAAAPVAPACSAVQPSMATNLATSTGSSSWCDLSYGSATSQNKRAYQEDRSVAAMLHSSRPPLSQSERFAMAAVFDGHGGAAAAEHLQQHMVSTLQEKLQQHSQPDAALAATVADLEAQLLAAQCNSGSTLTAVLLDGETLYTANVGDSRAVLCRDGKAEPLTSDHKASCQQEKARILAADPSADISADGYCYGLGVSRDLGNYKLKVNGNSKGLTAVPETSTQQLQKGDDFIVVGSDGLFDSLRNNDAIATVRRVLAATPGDCTAAAQAAVDRAIALGSSDNVTAVVLLLHSRPIQLPKSNSRLFRNRSASSSSSSSASSSDNSSCGSGGSTCSSTAGDSSTG